MAPILYDLSVPVYIRALENLLNVLKKGEEHAKENGYSADKLVEASLGHGMHGLAFQVQSASNTSKAIVPRLGDGEAANMEDNEKTYAQLYERVQKTIDVLKKAKPDNFKDKEASEVVIKMPSRELRFSGLTYLQSFGMPNFWFHVVTAYDILRKEGVPVGKMDFLGSIQ